MFASAYQFGSSSTLQSDREDFRVGKIRIIIVWTTPSGQARVVLQVVVDEHTAFD